MLALPGGAALAASIDGNGRRVAADPYWGTVARRAGVRVEPRVRGRPGARNDEQPELRQPREAAHRLAAHRGGARDRRRLPRARGADHRRQRLALQRGRRGRADLPDARHRHGRAPAGRRARRPPRVRARRATPSRSPATSHPSLAASELAKLRGEALPDGLPPFEIDAGHRRAGGDPRGRARGPALERPRHRRGRLRRRGRRVLPGGRDRGDARPRPLGGPVDAALRRRARAASSSPAIRPRSPSWPSACRSTSSAPSAATRCTSTIAGEQLDVPLDELREAHDALRASSRRRLRPQRAASAATLARASAAVRERPCDDGIRALRRS